MSDVVVKGRRCEFVLNQGENLDGTKYDLGWYIGDGNYGYFVRPGFWRLHECGDEGHWPTREAAEQFARAAADPPAADLLAESVEQATRGPTTTSGLMLKYARLFAHFGLREFAEHCQIIPSDYCMAEKGERDLSAAEYERVLNALEVARRARNAADPPAQPGEGTELPRIVNYKPESRCFELHAFGHKLFMCLNCKDEWGSIGFAADVEAMRPGLLKHYKRAAHEIGDLFCWCVENLKKFPPGEGEWTEEVKRRLLANAAVASDFDAYLKSLAEWAGVDMHEFALPSAHGNDRLRWVVMIQEKLCRASELQAAQADLASLRSQLQAMQEERDRLAAKVRANDEFEAEIDAISDEPLSEGQVEAIANNVVAVSKIGKLEAALHASEQSRRALEERVRVLSEAVDSVLAMQEPRLFHDCANDDQKWRTALAVYAARQVVARKLKDVLETAAPRDETREATAMDDPNPVFEEWAKNRERQTTWSPSPEEFDDARFFWSAGWAWASNRMQAHIGTEQTMHKAWRKRAEEAEAQLTASEQARQTLEERVRVLSEAIAEYSIYAQARGSAPFGATEAERAALQPGGPG